MKKGNLINIGVIMMLSGMAVQGYHNYVIHSQEGFIYPISLLVAMAGAIVVLVASRKKK